jgi:hypothetical protein
MKGSGFDMDESLAYGHEAPDERPWSRRMWGRLFPVKHCFLPDAPPEYADCVVTTTICTFGFWDRIRILFSGVLVVQTKTVTQCVVGKTITAGESYPGLRCRDLPHG